MGIKVLFLYPNTFGMNMIPQAMALFSSLLKKEGHEVIEASNVEDAIDLYKKESPDMVFLDVLIPGSSDGFTALQNIVTINPNAIVVMVTSLKEKEDLDKANKYGAKGYITKPFSSQQITEALKNNL